MPQVTGAFSHLLAPGLNKVFFMHMKDHKPEFTRIYHVTSSKRNYEENLEVAALPVMGVKGEGTGVLYQEFIQGGVKRFTHVVYAQGFRVTEEMMEDDLYGVMRKNGRALKRSAMVSKEQAAMNVLNNSFSTEYGFPKNGVNEALISTSHTLLGGGTASNRPATDVDVSFAALEASIVNYSTQLDERGMPIDIEPQTLLHHPNDMFLVEQLLQSAYRPFTGNNEINPLKGRLTPMSSRYITDPDAWWVLGEKSEDGLVFFNRRELRFQAGDDFDTGDAKFKASWRGAFGASEWRYLYGSTGAS